METNTQMKNETNTRRLLDLDDPRYMKRLVRELNGTVDGFYNNGRRFGRARFRADFERVEARTNGHWVPLVGESVDAYGRGICASRKP